MQWQWGMPDACWKIVTAGLSHNLNNCAAVLISVSIVPLFIVAFISCRYHAWNDFSEDHVLSGARVGGTKIELQTRLQLARDG